VSAAPVILLGVSMLSGLVAVALLVRRLAAGRARRATTLLSHDEVEDELQEILAEAADSRRASSGA